MEIKEIEALRKKHHLSMREFSLSIGYSHAYYSGIIDGSIELTNEFISKIHEQYDKYEDSDYSSETILARIKEVTNNDSLYKIAKKAGISNSSLSDVNLKKTYPTIRFLTKIAKAYDSDPHYLKYGIREESGQKKEKSAYVYENIRIIMDEKGITQKEMCEKLNVNRITLWRMLNGKSTLDMNTLFDIAGILGVSIAELALTYDELKALIVKYTEGIK